MLLVNIGIIFGSYVGLRLFERYKSPSKKMALQPVEKTPDFKQVTKVAKDSGNLQPLKSTVIENPVENEIEKEYAKNYEHHFKVSTVALALVATSFFYPSLTILTIGVLIYSSIPILKQAENSLLNKRRFDNDVLSAIVDIMTLAMAKYPACAIQVWAYHFGYKMVTRSKDMSTKMLKDVFAQQPSKVWVLKDFMEIEVPLETLQLDDVVVVKAGEVMPIDGIITSGMATIDQHALTGEAVPAEKGIGDQVFAATIVVSGKLHVNVEKTGLETTVAKLGEILNHTADFKTNLQLRGEELADKAAKPLASVGVLSLPILGVSSATAILFSAPTNTIRILTSLQTFNHLTLLSDKGILVKDGCALEKLTEIDTVIFDKTGTLTHGQPEIGQIIRGSEFSEDEILTYAAAAEHRLTHPIAHAILQKAEECHLNLPDIEDANYKIGYGVTVSFNNQVIKVGSARFITSEGIVIPPKVEEAGMRSQEEGYSMIMVAVNHQLIGAIEIRPQVRPEVKKVISSLRQRGIKHIYVVSGDYERPTQKLAQELSFDDYYSEVLPQNKASLVEQLQKEGRKVCFIGDGINDVIAMKQANVSISLSGASSIATDMAGVVLMDGSLSRLDDLFDISTKLNTNLKYSLRYWGGYGTINIINNSLLGVGVTKSIVFYGVAFGLGFAHSMLPLRQLEHKEEKPVIK